MSVQIYDDNRSLHAIGDYINSYEPFQNSFCNSLINRIAMVRITSKRWQNYLKFTFKGRLEYGDTLEEIFVNIAKVQSFNPEKAETDWMKRTKPDIRAAFHTRNWQKQYPVTISVEELRAAFLTWDSLSDLIARIVDSLYTAMEYDEFLATKYIIARAALNGDMYTWPVSTQVTEAGYKNLIQNARLMSTMFTNLSTKYNASGVYTHTDRADQYVFIDAATEAAVDVNVLASAFNMDKTEFLGHLVTVDSFTVWDTTRLALLFGDDYQEFTETELTNLGKIRAILADIDWFMNLENLDQMTQAYNGMGLYWQYWLNVWRTFSYSPFHNVVCFFAGTSAVSNVAVSPSTATVDPGQSVTIAATVTGTGLFDKQVEWEMDGEESTDTSLTYEGGKCVLNVGSLETSTTITVTATSTSDSTKYATATVTVNVPESSGGSDDNGGGGGEG